jgi:hypothetical protein
VETLIAARGSLAIAGALLLASAGESSADDFPLKSVKPFTYVVDYEPFWSPDDREIVLISNRHGGMKVHVMNANSINHGSDMRQLTFDDAEDDSPAWSPDGKKIAFVSIRGGVSQICVMNADGTDVRQLTTGSAENIHPMWSLDSEKILFNTTHFSGTTAAGWARRAEREQSCRRKDRRENGSGDDSARRHRSKKNYHRRRIHLRFVFAGWSVDLTSPRARRVISDFYHEYRRFG